MSGAATVVPPDAGTHVPEGQYLSLQEAGRVLNIDPNSVGNAISRGRLHAVRFAHTWLIPAAEVGWYAANRAISGPGDIDARREQQDANDASSAADRRGEWLGQAVWYLAGDGRRIHVSRREAQALAIIGHGDVRKHQGTAVDLIREHTAVDRSRRWVVALIEHFVRLGLVARVSQLDSRGAHVPTVWVSTAGEQLLAYCRERGLI